MSADDVAEDQLISNILAVTLRPTNDSSLYFLATLAAVFSPTSLSFGTDGMFF